jgi:radical SAM superfamily enzyme
MMMESVNLMARSGVTGIKIHSLHIVRGSIMAFQYKMGHIPMFSREEYIGWVCDSLERLPPQMQIHRLTGDGLKHLLIAPDWSRDKRLVLTAIHKEMARRGTVQGEKYLPITATERP